MKTQATKNQENLWVTVIQVVTVFFLTYVLSISTGWTMAILLLFLYVCMFAVMRTLPSWVALVAFIVATLFYSTTIPKGSFIYKKDGSIEHTLNDAYLVSPFIHRKPFESGPHPKAGYLKGNNLPKGWYVSVEYIIPDPTKVSIKDWIILKSMAKEGVDIPKELFEAHSHQQKYIEEYFIKEYPFIKTNVEARYKK